MTIDPDKPIIKLKDVQVSYANNCLLDIPEVSIMPGERVFVLGKSGSGKTTLSNILKGRIATTQGQTSMFGREYTSSESGLHKYVAMIDQEFNLIPKMSVIHNVLTGALGRISHWRSLFGLYPTSEWAKAESILEEVELQGLGERRVDTLSGGQKQRVAIARALMQESAILLADEPISNLDPELAEDALELLVACTSRRNETLIVNLHQPRLARKFATRVLGLYEGRVVFDGSPDKLSETDEEFIYVGGDTDQASSTAPLTTKPVKA